jgi:hypothetical protein
MKFTASLTVGLILIVPSFASASALDPNADMSLGLAQRSWLENLGKALGDSDGKDFAEGATPKPSGQSGLNALVVKFSKYDVLFRDLIDNAIHGSTDGYLVKYKFVF